jgi:cell division protein FtsA
LGQKTRQPAMPEEHSKSGTPIKPKGELLDLKALGIQEELNQKVSKDTVVTSIIRPRVREIFELVGKEIKKSGFGSQTPSGLVICGGGAQTVGILEQAKYVLGYPARLGKPEGMTGLTDEIDSPTYASAAGIIMYGAKSSGSTSQMNLPGLPKGLPLKDVMQKGITLLKSFLP